LHIIRSVEVAIRVNRSDLESVEESESFPVVAPGLSGNISNDLLAR